jgi:hypothetical protein
MCPYAGVRVKKQHNGMCSTGVGKRQLGITCHSTLGGVDCRIQVNNGVRRININVKNNSIVSIRIALINRTCQGICLARLLYSARVPTEKIKM